MGAILDLTDENVYYVRDTAYNRLFTPEKAGIEGKLECYEWMYRNCTIIYNDVTN